jgi:dTDP-4-dehydrorhamnose 3,5-epimerase-like enzyme
MDADRVPIPDVVVHQLTTHVDVRGSVTEIFRSSWGGVPIRQWTVISLGARVIRGPSVQLRHSDAVIALTAVLTIGLRDLRAKSPAFRQSSRLTLPGLQPTVVFIPPGIMHTFYASTEPTLVIVGSTHEYDADDDIKCRWQDAGLDLDESVVGTIDSRARSLDDVIAALRSGG